MARYVEPTLEQQAAWQEWMASRPAVVKAIAERFDPWSLYKLKPTRQRVTLAAINEDGTLRVNVSAEFNFVLFARSVFGINPDDLESCELPDPGDALLGAVLSDSDVGANIDALRVLVRPDLWELDTDGKVVEKR